MTELPPPDIFAIEFSALAREIAMDIFPIEDIIALHRLTDEEWERIQTNPKFQQMLTGMIQEWNSASNTRERVKVKAATGLESILETYIADIKDDSIPLGQRVEAGKFLARIGELDGNQQIIGGGGGSGFSIVLNIGNRQKVIEDVQLAPTIDGEVVSA